MLGVEMIKPLTDLEKKETQEMLEAMIKLVDEGFYFFDIKNYYRWFINLGRMKTEYGDLYKQVEDKIFHPNREKKKQEKENTYRIQFDFLLRNVKEKQEDMNILNEYSILDRGEYLVVGSPYYDNHNKKTRFKFTKIVSEQETPKFYNYIKDNFTLYVE